MYLKDHSKLHKNIQNISTYTFNDRILNNHNLGLFNISFICFLYLYIILYPPFRGSAILELVVFRLISETLLLIILLIKSQFVGPGKIQVNLLWAGLVVIIFGIFSPENFRNVFSFLNKILFFFLLLKVLKDDYKSMITVRKIWIYLWYFISFSAIVALIGNLSGVLSFYQYDYYNSYSYQFYPLVGSIKYRGFFNYNLQQYVGWMFEPGHLAYYFGLNTLLSDLINQNKNQRFNWFKIFNMIGGLLTFSFSFYLFFALYSIFILFEKIKIKFALYLFIPVIIYSIFSNTDLINYTSMDDRIWRIEDAIIILSKMNIMEMIFGMGTYQSRAAMEGGFTVGFLGMFIGRGLLVTLIYFFIIINYNRYNYTLLIFILYYSLIFGDMVFYPLSLILTVLG